MTQKTVMFPSTTHPNANLVPATPTPTPVDGVNQRLGKIHPEHFNAVTPLSTTPLDKVQAEPTPRDNTPDDDDGPDVETDAIILS